MNNLIYNHGAQVMIEPKEAQEITIRQDLMIAEAISQIHGNPHCNKTNCYGRGYTGIKIDRTGAKYVLLCLCGKFGENEYTRLANRIDAMLAHTDDLLPRVTFLNEMEKLTLAGSIRAIYRKLRGRGKLPVIGEVKAH